MNELIHENISHCKVPGSLHYVAQAAALLKDYCEQRLIDPSKWVQIELAFCEALNNAIEHGCAGDATKTVRLLWKWEQDRLTIEIEDPGDWAPNSVNAFLPKEPLDESGRGCFIIETVFDLVNHERTDYGHKLVLKKHLHPPYSAVEKLQETYESLLSATGELNRCYAQASVIQDLASDIASTPSPNEFIAKSIERLRSAVDLPYIEVWIATGANLESRFHSSSDAVSKTGKLSLIDDHENPLVKAFKEQHSRRISDRPDPPQGDSMYSQFECTYIEPILYRGESQGVIAIRYAKSDSLKIELEFVDLIRSLAQLIAIAFANAEIFKQRKEHERSEAQLEVASEIQQSLLPSEFPQNEHCRLIGKCVTALAVGGDYIDAIEIRGQGVLLIIADVMGKGVPAAMLATIFRTAIRSRLNLAETPGWLLSKIDEQIHEELGHLNMFITAQAAYFSYDKKTLKLSSAGHCPAFLMKSNESATEELTAEGIPLGINPTDIYEERIINLSAGDRVLFITDGIYEIENASGQMLGIEGFSKHLPDIWEEGLDAVPEKALAVVSKHSQGSDFQDDKTLMALEVL